jgi:hypothetical protein
MAKSTVLTPPPRVQALAATLSHPQPMRRGSVSERWMKCGKLGCPCATDRTARHGPYFSVTRAVHGRTVSRYVTAEEAVVVRRQIAAAQAFRKEIAAVWAACEAWADEELAAATPARPEGGEKGGSTRRSPRKLRPRSRS